MGGMKSECERADLERRSKKKNLLSSKWFNLLQAFILRFYKTYGRRIKKHVVNFYSANIACCLLITFVVNKWKRQRYLQKKNAVKN